MVRMKLPVESIRVDPTVLPRCRRDEATIKNYVAIYRRTGDMPPIDVFYDGEVYWLADGNLRLEAQKDCGEKEVLCEWHKGSKTDATWFAAGANKKHGRPLTATERRHGAHLVLLALSKKSDTAIADEFGIDVRIVASERQKIQQVKGEKKPDERDVRTTKAGVQVDVSKIGSKKKGGRPTKAQQAAREAQVLKDGLGQPIPDRLRQVAEDTTLIDTALTAISNWMQTVERLVALPSGAGKHIEAKYVTDCVQEIRKHLLDAKYYCSCPECVEKKTKAPASCQCKGESWYTRTGYNEKYLA